MAFEKVSSILEEAQKANTAVLSLMCLDYNMAYAAVATAEEMKTPVILMMLPEHSIEHNILQVQGFVAMAKELADQVNVAVGVHMDHCSDYEYIIRAIKKGMPSVMVDGSIYSIEENIALSKKVVETAHMLGVDVEAELGHVGMADEVVADQEDGYTDPSAAARFCEETNVDALTVAVGSAHGVYLQTPRLDIERLEKIKKVTKKPLVLHGGSGIPHEQLEEAFVNGINKFNVGTEFMDCYYDAMEEFVELVQSEERSLKILDFSKFAQERLIEYLREKMKLCKL